MIQTIIPRPIAWVLTTNQGTASTGYNLAPFSYFAPISSSPPVLLFSVGQKPDGNPKDTLTNIEAGSEFIVHIASSDLAPQVNESAAGLPYGQSELDDLDLKLTNVSGWGMPRLEAAKVAFNCQRFDITPIRESIQTLVLGKITGAYIEDSLVSSEENRLQIDASKIDPLARLGGTNYTSIGPAFTTG